MLLVDPVPPWTTSSKLSSKDESPFLLLRCSSSLPPSAANARTKACTHELLNPSVKILSSLLLSSGTVPAPPCPFTAGLPPPPLPLATGDPPAPFVLPPPPGCIGFPVPFDKLCLRLGGREERGVVVDGRREEEEAEGGGSC